MAAPSNGRHATLALKRQKRAVYISHGQKLKRKRVIDFYDTEGWNGMTKYGPDGLSRLLPEDDAATVIMGRKWRTPTESEWRALLDKDRFTWTRTVRTDRDGNKVPGCEVTSKISGYEGKSIFLPLSGNMFQRVLQKYGTEGGYWSSESIKERGYYGRAWALLILERDMDTHLYRVNRYFGENIRAVTTE